MKKEVQALLKRRRARAVPYLLFGMALLIVVLLIGLIVNFFISGPGVTMFNTATPTATITITPTATRPSATPTLVLPTLTPSNTAGPSPTPTAVVYIVQEGDTLFNIAVQFQLLVDDIKTYNNLTSDGLSVGQILTIPVGIEIPTVTPTPLPTGLARGSKINYVVQLGDTLEVIAAKFLSTVEDISKNNNNVTNATLQAGQTLVVRVFLVTPTRTPIPTFTPQPPPLSPTP